MEEFRVKKEDGRRKIYRFARARAPISNNNKKNGLETKNPKDPVGPADGSGVSLPPLFSPLIDWAIVFAGNDSGRNGLPPKPRRIDNKRSIRVPRHSATSASCSSANKRKRNDIRLFRAPNPSTTREEKVLGRRQYRRIFHPHWLNKKLVFVFCWESAGGAFGFDSKVKL